MFLRHVVAFIAVLYFSVLNRSFYGFVFFPHVHHRIDIEFGQSMADSVVCSVQLFVEASGKQELKRRSSSQVDAPPHPFLACQRVWKKVEIID